MRKKVDDLESIDKLRDIIADVNVAELSANIQQPIGTGRDARVSPGWVDAWQRAANRALEEIDRELADRYIELPVDMDGVPIHELDTLYDRDGKEFIVTRLAMDGGWTVFSWGKPGRPQNYRHVRPRTLEDVLRELANEVWEASCTCQTSWSDSGLDGIEKRYVEEICELLEVEQ